MSHCQTQFTANSGRKRAARRFGVSGSNGGEVIALSCTPAIISILPNDGLSISGLRIRSRRLTDLLLIVGKILGLRISN